MIRRSGITDSNQTNLWAISNNSGTLHLLQIITMPALACRRFYRIGNMQTGGYNQAGGSAAQHYEMSEMRTTPTVTVTFANQQLLSIDAGRQQPVRASDTDHRDSDGQLQRRWQLHRDGGLLMTKRKPGALRELSKSDGTVYYEDV